MTHPCIILVRPQMGENIGAAARAMLNFGLESLRIVSPRDGWPNPKAEEMAVGAVHVLHNAALFESFAEAIADLQQVYASTARLRDMEKKVLDPQECMQVIQGKDADKCGIVFGPEKSGLTNEEVVLCRGIVSVPVNPDYPSLNLAQAVAVLSYEWSRAKSVLPPMRRETSPAATHEEMSGLFNHLEEELEKRQFFLMQEKKPKMVQNIRNTFQKAEMTAQEVSTMRGIIRCLTTRK